MSKYQVLLRHKLNGQEVALSDHGLSRHIFTYLSPRDFVSYVRKHMLSPPIAGDAMREGKSPVIVDNTNTCAWEMKPYVNMVRVCVCACVCVGMHGVLHYYVFCCVLYVCVCVCVFSCVYVCRPSSMAIQWR